ncbi:MAG TPA: protein kinase [Gemmatales bacterium]|nr:protein kinase [Gemmatales bacterium]
MSEHPASETLADFGNGLLDEEVHQQVEEHLHHCEECQAYVAQLPEDRFTKLFRSAASTSSAQQAKQQTGYELLGELGRGGMGVVYRARDRKLNRQVALKKIKNGSLANRQEQERFLREARIVAKLVHPGIVQIYEVGEETSDDGLPLPFFVMELVEGESLAQRLERGKLDEKEAATLIESLARTIHAAHLQGIVHRDLKPANILLSDQEPALSTVKIADFGLAKLIEAKGQSGLSLGGTLMGTPGYMAPEQIRGTAEALGPGTDVYALGAILYECLTGQTPYPKETSLAALEAVFQHDPASVCHSQPGVSRELEAICLKCLQQEPGNRYESALALADDIARWRRLEPILARHTTARERIVKWIRRHPWPTALIGLVALMTFAVILGLSIFALKQQQAIARIEKEKARADANYRSARQTISRMLSRINEMKTKRQEGVREFHSRQLEDVLAFHESAMMDVDADQPQVQFDTAQTLIEIATLQSTLGRHAAAEASLKRAMSLLDRRTDDAEQVIAARLVAWNKLGSVQLALGKPDDAIASYQRSQELARQLNKEHPDKTVYQYDVAWSHHNLGAAYTAQKKFPQAEQEFVQAVQLRQAALKQQGRNHDLRRYLAESQTNLALVLHQRVKRVEAEKHYAEAEQSMRQLVKDLPENLEFSASLAALLLNKGNVVLELGRIDEALGCYRDGLVMVHDVLEKEPLLAFARQLLLPLNGACANLLEKTGRPAEAIPYWDQVVKLAAPHNRLYRCMRIGSLASAQKIDLVITELDQMLSDKDLSKQELSMLLVAVEGAAKRMDETKTQGSFGQQLAKDRDRIKQRISDMK